MIRRGHRVAMVVLCGALLAGCASTPDESGFSPATTQPIPPLPTTVAPPETVDCTNDAQTVSSYAPTDPLPAAGRMPAGSFMAEIAARDRLIVGVSADTLLFGARNPFTGQLEGFDIDMVKQVALAIFGGPEAEIDKHIEYRVINYAARMPSIESGAVDIVAHTMTINCQRWQRIAFSSQYFDSGQKVLVRSDSPATDVYGLSGASICAADGSTNIDNIKALESQLDLKVVGFPDLTDCLVQFQQGSVDAVTGDDTVLAGFVAQDPYAKVVGEPFSEEPYGLGMSLTHPEFVRFVNSVLERMRAGTTWTDIYTKWLGESLGAVPAPPPALYGRQP